MDLQSGGSASQSSPAISGDEVPHLRAVIADVVAQASVSRVVEMLSLGLARVLNAPLAILSRDSSGWRLEADAFPASHPRDTFAKSVKLQTIADPVKQLQEHSGDVWTLIALGNYDDREWAMLLPGASVTWVQRPGFEHIIEDIGQAIAQVTIQDRVLYQRRFDRTLHAFTHRLARHGGDLPTLVLRTLSRQVRAETGALAVFSDADDALAIVATVGYPRALVEHLRIEPGVGLIGRVYESGRPFLGGSSTSGSARRLRYRTDSYMVIPICAERAPVAVIALTDRADGRPFDVHDFNAARLLSSVAASAFTRERLRARLEDLTKLATVDPVTGLFNRRYFETRLQAEVERSRRQRQSLAVLLIDIDDFKEVNDTRGHLEGDRTLREVADLLRAGVRIFDVCARYGGEEFVIVMPAASEIVARQVAERIRIKIERNFHSELPRVTVSIGIGMLTGYLTANELVGLADRGLISAKRAGKNLVCIGGDRN